MLQSVVDKTRRAKRPKVPAATDASLGSESFPLLGHSDMALVM